MNFINFIKKLIPFFLLSWYHFLLAFLGAFLYCFPSRKLKVIGITGTNGKSTTVELARKVLEDNGYNVASLSSIKIKIKDKERKNMFKMTMPGRFNIQNFLNQAFKAGCQYALLEVTSEGIKQHRHRFIQFEVVVFTNLTPEHIESHGSFEKYKKAKGELFRATKKIHIINKDDKNSKYFLGFFAKKKYLYQIQNQESPASNLSGKIKIIDQNLKVLEEMKEINLNLKLLGDFNLYNSLSAICVGLSQGVDFEKAKKSVQEVNLIPGRMEQVINSSFRVIIDYAVTPDALEKLYQTIKHRFSPKKIITVFGSCGGGRDKWKRPILGKIASKYCDQIVITNEDPYDEDPYYILSMIKSGIFGSGFPPANLEEILDRRKAIQKSLELAGPDDVILITGKGSEPWMSLAKGKKISWSDKQVVLEEFEKLKINNKK